MLFLQEKIISRIFVPLNQHLSCHQLKAFYLVDRIVNRLKYNVNSKYLDLECCIHYMLKEKRQFCLRI